MGSKIPQIEIAQLESFMQAFCSKYNCQLYVVLARPTPILDEHGRQPFDLITKSYIQDDLIFPIKELVDAQVNFINNEKKGNKNIN